MDLRRTCATCQQTYDVITILPPRLEEGDWYCSPECDPAVQAAMQEAREREEFAPDDHINRQIDKAREKKNGEVVAVWRDGVKGKAL